MKFYNFVSSKITVIWWGGQEYADCIQFRDIKPFQKGFLYLSLHFLELMQTRPMSLSCKPNIYLHFWTLMQTKCVSTFFCLSCKLDLCLHFLTNMQTRPMCTFFNVHAKTFVYIFWSSCKTNLCLPFCFSCKLDICLHFLITCKPNQCLPVLTLMQIQTMSTFIDSEANQTYVQIFWFQWKPNLNIHF